MDRLSKRLRKNTWPLRIPHTGSIARRLLRWTSALFNSSRLEESSAMVISQTLLNRPQPNIALLPTASQPHIHLDPDLAYGAIVACLLGLI
jgi:hypothetical protein